MVEAPEPKPAAAKANADKIAVPALKPNEAEAWSERLGSWRALKVKSDFMLEAEAQTLQSNLPNGKPVVVAFWASYCPPCLEEMPMFSKFADAGQAVLGVSLDGDNQRIAQKILSVRKPRYSQVILQEDAMKEAGLALESGLPFTLILNAEGRPVIGLSGKVDEAQVQAAVNAAASSG